MVVVAQEAVAVRTMGIDNCRIKIETTNPVLTPLAQDLFYGKGLLDSTLIQLEFSFFQLD